MAPLAEHSAVAARRRRNLDFAAPVMVADGPRFTRDACLVWNEADDGVLEE